VLTDGDETTIRQVLRAFESAFQDASTAELKRVYPLLTRPELAEWDRRLSLDNSSYRLSVTNEKLVAVSSTSVRVDCLISHEFVPRRGEPGRLSNAAVIVLDKVDDGWVISSIRGPGWR
jgi:hypothetical protein